MRVELWLLPLCLLLGFAGARWVSRRGRLDPLERRRLHTVATPRGGGIGIAVAGLLTALVIAAQFAQYESGCEQALSVLYAFLALLAAAGAGAWEDRYGLAARWRLLLHLIAGVFIVAATQAHAPLWLQCMLVVGVAGLINLVNFMDGAHGLIGLQGLVIGLAMHDPFLALACLGFLPMNFPHARVFLGDVGSYALGTWIAYLWMNSAAGPLHWSAFALGWIVLLPILTDAGLTLLSRMLRGRRWYSAHREHLYQWCVRVGYWPYKVSLVYALITAALALLVWQFNHDPTQRLLLAVVLSIVAGATWWCGKVALLQLHRRQLRAARRLRRSGSAIE